MTAAAMPSDDRAVRVTLPMWTLSEANARSHWAAKARRTKMAREAVGLVVGIHLRTMRVRPPCVVTLTRIAPSAGLDGDNLQSALKATRDGVADALGVDDRDPRVEWRYEQRRGKRGEVALALGYGVEIRVCGQK